MKTQRVLSRAFLVLVLVFQLPSAGIALPYPDGPRADGGIAPPRKAAPTASVEPLCSEFGALAAATVNTLLHSPWLDQRRELASMIATGLHWQTMVAPVEVAGYGFDDPERILIAAQISRALAVRGAKAVSDPFLMAQLGGEYARVPDVALIRETAKRASIPVIYWPRVCHNRRGEMRLLLAVETAPGGTTASVSHFGPFTLDYSGTSLPNAAVARLLNGGVDVPGLGGGDGGLPAVAEFTPAVQQIPADLLLPEDKQPSPVEAAYRLQLIGALMPRELDTTRTTPHAATLAALHGVSTTDDVAMLRARALYYLGRREAAIAEIGTRNGADAQALLALLDGNAVDARNHVSRIIAPLPRLLAEIDLFDINTDYDLLTPTQRRDRVLTIAGQPSWLPLLERRLSLRDMWAYQENTELLDSLDGGKAVLANDPPGDAPGISVSNSFVYTGGDTDPFRAAVKRQSGNLLDAMMLANGLHAVRFLYYVRFQTDYGRAVLEDIKGNLYEGHPDLALLDADIAVSDLEYSDRPDRGALEASAVERTLNAALIAQVQHMHELSVPDLNSAAQQRWDGLWRGYQGDYPFVEGYCPTSSQTPSDAVERDFRAALAASMRDYDCMLKFRHYLGAVRKDEAAAKALLTAGETRNKDAPVRFAREVDGHLADDDIAGAIATYKRWIDAGSNSAKPYTEISRMALIDGDAATAWNTLQRYPGFGKDSDAGRVALSKIAANAAYEFYKAGEFDKARVLDERAVGYQTSSAGEYASYIRLHALSGDYRAQADIRMKAYRHYGSVSFLMGYVQNMFILGDSAEAWRTFEAEKNVRNGDWLLWAGISGLRIEGRTDDEVMEWFRRPDFKRMNRDEYRPAAEAAALNFTTDRIPPENLRQYISDLEGLPEKHIASDIVLIYRAPAKEPFSYIQKAIDNPEKRDGQSIPSELVRYVEMQWQISRKNYARACDVVRQVHQPFKPEPDKYLTPYAAYACAMAGDVVTVPRLLQEMVDRRIVKSRLFNYDYQLSQAFLMARDGNIEGARIAIGRATRLGSNGGGPQYDFFQLLQAYEWLHGMTGNESFRKDGLAYARIQRRGQPGFAFTHAYVARWTADAGERIDALASAIYLDRHSATVQSMSKSDLAKAERRLRTRNPFNAEKPEPGI